MANIKSQKKRIRTNEKARMRNRAVRSELKTLVKHVHEAVEEGNVEAAQAAASRCYKRLDQAASQGNLPKNQAATRTSGGQNLVNTLQ